MVCADMFGGAPGMLILIVYSYMPGFICAAAASGRASVRAVMMSRNFFIGSLDYEKVDEFVDGRGFEPFLVGAQAEYSGLLPRGKAPREIGFVLGLEQRHALPAPA